MGYKIKMKLNKFFSQFRLSNLIAEIKLLGFEISGKNILFVMFAFLFSGFIAGFLLHLRPQYVAVLLVSFFLCIPSMIIMKFRHDYEVRRFNDIVNYMEQLIYAFHKSGKIYSSLVDVYEVSTGRIKQIVQNMLDILDTDMTTSHLYEKAFALMQNEYDCTRLKILHDYILSIEMHGGESAASLNILLDDIREWSERVLLYQTERKSVQGKTMISIFCALLSCGIMINLIPNEYVEQIITQTMYQVGTLVILVLNVLVYCVSSNRVCMSYLDNELDRKHADKLNSQVKYLANYHKKNHVKISIIKCLILAPALAACIYFNIYWGVTFLGCMMFVLLTHDALYKNTCLQTVTREIKKTFPIWLRNLVLYLQTDNVHVAVRNSFDNCPKLLRKEVENFLDAIEKDPVSMKPYVNFLGQYPVQELKLAVHYLYSLATFGSGDMLAQLDYLIKQNSKLEIAEEKIRNEDSLAGFTLIILIPMLLAVCKLLIDLVLFLQIFMGYLSVSGTVG